MLLALLASLASAQEVGAIIRPELEVDLVADREHEDDLASRTRFRAWARGETGVDSGPEGSWFLEVRGTHEILVGDDTEGKWDAEMGEAGWEGRVAGPLRLRAGNLVERWGKLDLLPVMDVLNPRDLRYGPSTPQELQRVPVPMVVASLGVDGFRSETTWLPFAVHDRIALRDTDWSFVRQGMIADQQAEVATWESGATGMMGGNTALRDALTGAAASLTDLDPSFRRALDAALLEKNQPQDVFTNGELGQRFVFGGRGFDFAVMGARIHNRQPLGELDPFLATLLREERLPEIDLATLGEIEEALDAFGEPYSVAWPMTWVAGAEASTVVGPVGVRAEGGWRSDRVVRQRWGAASTVPSVAGGVGLDYVRGSSLMVSVEGRWERLLSPPDDLLFARPDMVQVAGGLRWSTLSDRLTVQLGGSYDVTFDEWLALPKVSWRASDRVLLEGGAILLGGRTPAPGTLRDAMTYQGGLMSYFQQNDALTLGLSWIL